MYTFTVLEVKSMYQLIIEKPGKKEYLEELDRRMLETLNRVSKEVASKFHLQCMKL